MNAMYASSDGCSRSGEKYPRQRSEPEDRHRRKRSRSDDSYHREYDNSDDRHRHRMLKFGSDPPKLTKNTLESVAVTVDSFIKYLHQLLRADAFDDSIIIINLIDSETVGLLTYYLQPHGDGARTPITHHWTVDWDVATIIQALEELYPLQQELYPS